ncbi:15525_t:CDS:2, partial [Gigaspora margarita]
QVNRITNYTINLTPLSPKRQNELTKVIIEFIINDVQPLHILQNLSFHRMLLEFQPQYQIPCASTVKAYISEDYRKGINQLKEILVNTADIELFNIIHEWNLENKVCMIVMDNGSNMVKGIELLKDNCIKNVFWQPCAAHTLQLSVREGLKQIKSVHQRLKSIQAFFRLPKQAQRLRGAQMYVGSANLSQETDKNEMISPLEMLTDCRTHWNSAYLAWKRILELHPVMRSLAALLQINSNTISKKEGEKLDYLCLTS